MERVQMICSIRSSSSTVGATRGLKPHDEISSNSINHCEDSYVCMNLYIPRLDLHMSTASTLMFSCGKPSCVILVSLGDSAREEALEMQGNKLPCRADMSISSVEIPKSRCFMLYLIERFETMKSWNWKSCLCLMLIPIIIPQVFSHEQ